MYKYKKKKPYQIGKVMSRKIVKKIRIILKKIL